MHTMDAIFLLKDYVCTVIFENANWDRYILQFKVEKMD